LAQFNPKLSIDKGGLKWKMYPIGGTIPNIYPNKEDIITIQTTSPIGYAALEKWFALFEQFGAKRSDL
jgi:hypothetical protein